MKLHKGSTNLELLLKRRKISVKLWVEVNKISNFETLNEVLKREDYYLENSVFEEIVKLLATEQEAPQQHKPASKKTNSQTKSDISK